MAAASTSSSGVKWQYGLVDDTMGPVEPLSEATIKTKIAEIAQFRTNRTKGYHWVTHQLKVLVSDEEDDDDTVDEQYEGQDEDVNLAYDSDDSADMERYGIELSLQGAGTQVRPPRARATDRVKSDREVSQCPRCNKYPPFSRTRRTRQFRLVEPWKYLKEGDEHEACDHFVAVSYCWSSYESSSRTCQIRDCTGSRTDTPRAQRGSKGKSRDDNVYLSTENGRVPFDEVLDRAVEFASSKGLRCIWIDQACLPQDESDEHQTGVQSMDMVYQRARHTIGLLGSSIGSQEFALIAAWFTLMKSYVNSGTVPDQNWWKFHFFKGDENSVVWDMVGDGMPDAAQTAVGKTVCRAIVDFLQRIMDDKWYTRAWILQESVSAGTKLKLLLRVLPGLKYHPSPFMDPEGGLITTSQQEGSTFILTWKEFDNLQKGLSHMLKVLYDPDLDTPEDNMLLSRAHDITSPERIPRPHPTHERCGPIDCACSRGFVCNAACAISLLRGRYCLKAEDKVAIVANLCNFEIRLDTFQLAKRFKSLRLCLIALALLNADLSFLVPEFSALGTDDVAPLFQIAYMNLHKVNKQGIEPDNMPRIQAVSQPCLTPGGMILPAFLWCVDREVDFAPIRVKWADQWWSLKGMKESSSSIYKVVWERKKGVREYKRQEAHRILNNMRRRHLEGHSLRDQQDDRYPGVLFSASVPFSIFRRDCQAIVMIGDIVRDILSYLLHSDETELANSIWQSLRLPWYDVGGRIAFLPDKIDETLLKISNFGQLLNLNSTPDAVFAQEWLLDRVVLRGRLCVGHYIPSNIKGNGLASVLPFSVVSNDIYGGNIRIYSHRAPPQKPDSHSLVGHTLDMVRQIMKDKEPKDRQLLDSWATRPMSFEDSSIIGRDVVKASLYKELRFQWRSPESFKRLDNATILGGAALGLSPSMETFLHYTETYVGWDIEQQEERVHRRMSAFDVDGPCLVATPVDATRERIPHSDERTLSCCWVVEAKGMDVTDEEADWIRKEFVRYRRVVLGGSMNIPELSDLELKHVPESVLENVKPLRLKVLRSVQGVWDIIDPAPFQSFLFS